MNADNINALWTSIRMLDINPSENGLRPLEHLDAPLRHFELEPNTTITKKDVMDEGIFSKDPSFKESNHAILVSLRSCLYAGKEMNTVSIWADKLMRFCEVRLSSLRGRALEKCGSRAKASLLLLHICAFLLDYALYSKDLRYLNTALKLADMKWIVNEVSITRKLNGNPEAIDAALFQFRVLLTIEYVMSSLAGEGIR